MSAYQGMIKLYNGKRNYGLRDGETLKIPKVELELVAWNQERVAVLLANKTPIRLYEISTGAPETPTPIGDFTIDICEKEPMWYPPTGGAIPYGNEENPLGERWLGFEEDPSYAFHGTNSEETIGSFESAGCIRMHNAEVVELFELIGPGVKARILP